MAFGNFSLHPANKVKHRNNERAPLLLIAGAEDHLVPDVGNRIDYRLYRRSNAIAEYKEFLGRSHLIVAQDGWEEVADYALSWAQVNEGARSGQ
ncbi:MAG: hypothetical protein ACRES7_05915 [Gammaproteobacteria bacterium]